MTNGITIFSQIKDPKMAACGPDMDFCSAGEDDYLETEIHSPTDSSEDSVEVKVSPIISLRNKRKCSEPRKVPETFSGPLKKRMCLKIKAEENHPFRPWSPNKQQAVLKKTDKPLQLQVKSEPDSEVKTKPLPNSFVVPTVPIFYQPPVDTKPINQILSGGYFRPPSPIKFGCVNDDEQPVPLIKKDTSVEFKIKQECVSPNNSTINNNLSEVPRVPVHPQVAKLSASETERLIINTNEVFQSLQNQKKHEQNSTGNSSVGNRREQRNYKNMTRERRIEANARERTRVHTISAAFDTLRRSVPAYSHNQKLSKLSVLRIACSYIMTLSSIVNDDKPSTSESVDLVSKTIQREGKLRKKKDDND